MERNLPLAHSPTWSMSLLHSIPGSEPILGQYRPKKGRQQTEGVNYDNTLPSPASLHLTPTGTLSHRRQFHSPPHPSPSDTRRSCKWTRDAELLPPSHHHAALERHGQDLLSSPWAHTLFLLPVLRPGSISLSHGSLMGRTMQTDALFHAFFS